MCETEAELYLGAATGGGVDGDEGEDDGNCGSGGRDGGPGDLDGDRRSVVSDRSRSRRS